MSYEDVTEYSEATCQFYHKAYSDDFRMQKFAEANSHCTNSDIINAIEQELYMFEASKDSFAADMYLTEAQHYLNLLKYRHKQHVNKKFALNK